MFEVSLEEAKEERGFSAGVSNGLQFISLIAYRAVDIVCHRYCYVRGRLIITHIYYPLILYACSCFSLSLFVNIYTCAVYFRFFLSMFFFSNKAT